MSNNNIRQNFYQGQNVLAKDLNNLQDYSDINRNILVSDLLGSGILKGFEITHKEGFTFSISEGVAFDKNGNRLILEEPTEIVLTKPIYTNKKADPILIGIKHSYSESNPVKDSLDKETPTCLTPSVEFITGETIDEDVFQLATITLNESAKPLITKSEIFIPLPALTTIVATNKDVINKKVDDNTSAIENTNTDVSKNTSGVASNKASITNLTTTVSAVDKKVNDNNSAIDGRVNALTSTVSTNKSAIDGRVNTLTSTVSTNKTDITALKNKTNDPTFSNRIMSLINSSPFVWAIRSLAYPINSTYTQLPNKNSKTFVASESPTTLFGGSWELVKTVLIDNTPTVTAYIAPNIYNNYSDATATTYVYPDRTLVLVGSSTGGADWAWTSTIPFISISLRLSDPVGLKIEGAMGGSYSPAVSYYEGWSWGNSGNECVISLGYRSGDIKPQYMSTYKNRSFVGTAAYTTPLVRIKGYWKDPTAPISADEEKWYAKIWKRI